MERVIRIAAVVPSDGHRVRLRLTNGDTVERDLRMLEPRAPQVGLRGARIRAVIARGASAFTTVGPTSDLAILYRVFCVPEDREELRSAARVFTGGLSCEAALLLQTLPPNASGALLQRRER